MKFRELADGSIVVERVPTPEEMRGFATGEGTATDVPATQRLRERREREKAEREERFVEAHDQ